MKVNSETFLAINFLLKAEERKNLLVMIMNQMRTIM